MLENDRNLDEHVRFVGRLATAQDLELSQLQIEPEGSPNHGLRGERLNLHVKGDYPRIKALLIDTLAKFPGLVLQRMTVKHRDGTVSNASDNQSDDASLEFVQYGLASPTP